MHCYQPPPGIYCYIIVLQVVEVHSSIDREGSDDSQSGSLSDSREKLLPHVSLKHCCLFVFVAFVVVCLLLPLLLSSLLF